MSRVLVSNDAYRRAKAFFVKEAVLAPPHLLSGLILQSRACVNHRLHEAAPTSKMATQTYLVSARLPTSINLFSSPRFVKMSLLTPQHRSMMRFQHRMHKSQTWLVVSITPSIIAVHHFRSTYEWYANHPVSEKERRI